MNPTDRYRQICTQTIEAAGLGSEATDYRWHDGGCDPEDREIRIRLQELAEQIFSDGI